MWSAEIGWNAAMTSGGWALVLAARPGSVRRDLTAAALMVVAVMSSGVGLFFVIPVALAIVLRSAKITRLWVLFPAALLYGTWYLDIGHHAMQSGLLDRDHLRSLPDYMIDGVGSSFGFALG